MGFSDINVFAKQHDIPTERYSSHKLKEGLKTLFEKTITTYGIGGDNFQRNFITIFILNKHPHESITLPQFPINNVAEPQDCIYTLDKWGNRVTRSADICIENACLNHINLDLAIAYPDIAYPDIPPYKCFSIPQTVQNVFKSILLQGDFIGSKFRYDKHIRVVLHNENIFEDGQYHKPPPLMQKIWVPAITPSQDVPDTSKEEQNRKRQKYTPPHITFDFARAHEHLLNMTELTKKFEMMEID